MFSEHECAKYQKPRCKDQTGDAGHQASRLILRVRHDIRRKATEGVPRYAEANYCDSYQPEHWILHGTSPVTVDCRQQGGRILSAFDPVHHAG